MAKNGTLSSIPCDTQLPTLCLNLAPKAQFLMTRTNRQIKVQAPKAGTFQGYYDQNSFRFLGIRYAQSPVGDLRFREPQAYTPPANATEVQDATRYGSACIQLRSNDTTAAQAASFIMNQASENEDCLFLNVYTPSLRADASTPGLPVMVYIYGGGFLDNSGSTPLFEPGNVVSRGGVVVVSFNYRLGFLGTFQNKDGGIPASEAPGNLATRDQILALQWVRDNIEAFGGDPNRVTIFGESAGAYSIRALLTAPSAYSLYKNVIMQSDPLGLPLANATSMGYATNMTMQALGCSPSDIACARNKTVDEISAAQLKTVQGIDSPTSPYNWVAKEVFYRPAVDQDLIQGDLSQLAASNGPYNTNATIMWGFTHDDAGILIPIYLPLPVPPQSFNASVASLLPGFPGALFANASSVYPINTTDADGVRSMLSDAATDWYFRCPLFNVTRSLGSRSRLYSFEFDYGRQVPPVWPVRPSSFCNLPQRVCHGADIIPSFASANYFLAYPQTGVNARFARQIVDRFTTLAKTGTPNPTEDLPGYERLNPDVANVMLDPYTSSATNTVLFGATAGNVTQNLVKARCDYIEQNQHYLYEVYRS
ncbi:hypothetical protein DFQ27_006464 [Actinomortierella ambigua]|uniref:Carboxylic ester hydrolase n=1 Tax=Actinomortierella ambigua TaxID=1343610 RepID=A0A9P6UC47_9FUNG|nr:hypothetical protein DFQ27_006464 [Actinomortierella ambigua]